MILYGVSAEVSIGELFISRLRPGLLIGGALMLFVLPGAAQGLGQDDGDGRLPVPATASGGLGADDAGDHPRRHLRRRLHAHRGVGGGGVLRAGGGPAIHRETALRRPRGDPPKSVISSRGDHVHHRQRRTVRLPDHARRRARTAIGIWLHGGAAGTPPGWFLLGVNAALFVIGMFIETSAAIIVLRHPGAGGAALRRRPGALRHR